jgi:hypothetical protein
MCRHRELIAQGFLDYVNSLPAGSPLRPMYRVDKDGRRNEAMSHALCEFLYDTVEIEKRTDRMPNHAWRHTMESYLRVRNIRLDVSNGITGHGNPAKRTEARNYGEYERALCGAIDGNPNPLAA